VSSIDARGIALPPVVQRSSANSQGRTRPRSFS
jgi:hypothetical protein